MNVLVCGVGGQGVLLFSDLLASIAISSGLDVKKSEVHGMAQRGGSVTSHVRYSPRVYSPLIEEGTADLLVSFELLEALRHVHFLSRSGRLLYDPLRIEPLPVLLGLSDSISDDRLSTSLRARAPASLMVPAHETALRLGTPMVQNSVMLGAASVLLEFPVEAYQAAIRTLVKPQFTELNLAAFAAGRSLVGASR